MSIYTITLQILYTMEPRLLVWFFIYCCLFGFQGVTSCISFSYTLCFYHIFFLNSVISENLSNQVFPKSFFPFFPTLGRTSCFLGLLPSSSPGLGPFLLGFLSLLSWFLMSLKPLINVRCKSNKISEILHVWKFLLVNLYIKSKAFTRLLYSNTCVIK